MESALELYKKAYELQYHEHKIAEACQVYKTIIDMLPDTNEAAYSAIQLNKIGAANATRMIRRPGLIAMAVVLGVVLLVNLGTILFVVMFSTTAQREVNAAAKCAMLYARASSARQIGQTDEALKLLDSVKVITRADIAPYMLAADIYLEKRIPARAIAEFEVYRAIYPSSAAAADGIARVEKIQSELSMKTVTTTPPSSIAEPMQQTVNKPKKTYTRTSEKVRYFGDDEKGPAVVSDTLSYF